MYDICSDFDHIDKIIKLEAGSGPEQGGRREKRTNQEMFARVGDKTTSKYAQVFVFSAIGFLARVVVGSQYRGTCFHFGTIFLDHPTKYPVRTLTSCF